MGCLSPLALKSPQLSGILQALHSLLSFNLNSLYSHSLAPLYGFCSGWPLNFSAASLAMTTAMAVGTAPLHCFSCCPNWCCSCCHHSLLPPSSGSPHPSMVSTAPLCHSCSPHNFSSKQLELLFSCCKVSLDLPCSLRGIVKPRSSNKVKLWPTWVLPTGWEVRSRDEGLALWTTEQRHAVECADIKTRLLP